MAAASSASASLRGHLGVAHAGLVEQVVVAAGALGGVHRDVGLADQRVGVLDAFAAEGDADAHADGGDPAVAEVHGDVELAADARHDPGDAGAGRSGR